MAGNEKSADRIEDLIRERLRLDQELDRFQRLLSILYVDIVGSTRFYDEHGNTAGLVMVQKCLDLLIPIIQRNQGIIVKTIGDAILARFDSVEDSIHSGIEMIRGLAQRNAGRAPSDEIHIHVGINYGLCLLKDNDVFGDVVNVAARIEGAAGVDEIVVSPSVFEQIRNVPDFHVRKKSSGVELKGKAAKLDLYTVLWQGTPDRGTTPPPPSVDQLVMASGTHTNLAELARRIAASPTPPPVPASPTPTTAPTKVISSVPKDTAVVPTSGLEAIRFVLTCIRPDGSVEHKQPLDRPGITAGKQADISLADDPLVADQHVRFTQIGDQVFVEDLGSPQGVYVRVRTPQKLKEGDLIRLGQQLFRFAIVESDMPAVPTMPTNKTVMFVMGPAAKTKRAFLVRLGPDDRELGHCELHDAETIFGRSKGTYVFEDDPYLSSTHARVVHRDDKYFLEDLGSTNGSFLRMRKRAYIKEGDTVLIGKRSIRVIAERGATSGS